VIHGSSVLFNFIQIILSWYQSGNCFEELIADGYTEGDLDTSFNPISFFFPLLMTSTPPESSFDMRDTAKILIEEFSKKLSQIVAQSQHKSFEGMGQSHSSENPNSSITMKLDDHNYRIWAQMVEMELKTRNKLGYVKGDQKIPSTTDVAYKRWEIEDNIVKSWLIKSLDNLLVGSFINCSTAREVWEALAMTFFDGNDSAQYYDLRRKTYNLRQGDSSVETYYKELQGLWREMDYRRPNTFTGIENIERYNKIVQEERLFNFLNGLSDRLDQMRAHILQTSPLPTTE
jgi:gag-polypeptide of LTR copia-type